MLVTYRFTAEDPPKKQRLDRFLYEQIGTVSQMFLANLIEEKSVFVNGAPARAGYHLQPNDVIETSFDNAAETAMTPEDLPLDIVFEDQEILVVNKPAGMLVHPTKQIRTGTLANALAFHLNFQRQNLLGSSDEDQSAIRNPQSAIVRPGLVHRLDRETSGLLVVAKTIRAHRILSAHFARRLVKKLYLAIVENTVEADCGTITAPIGRTEEKPHWRVLETGKAAETRFRTLKKSGTTTVLELEPVTGRTNQLRVHCAHLGHPIVGDPNYGGREFSRLCLHAARLAFFHPNGGWLEFEAATPSEFAFDNFTCQ